MHALTRSSPIIHRLPSACGGFTLLELLIVIGIIGLLIAIGVPVITSAQARAREVTCINNLRQLGIASVSYAADFNSILPWDGYREGNQRSHPVGTWSEPAIWFNSMLAYAGQKTYDQLQLNDRNGAAPLPLARSACLMSCPSAPYPGPGDRAKDFVQNGAFLMWGIEPDGTTQQRKTFLCYGYNTQLDSQIEDRKTGYRVCIRLLALRQPSLTVLLTEKLMNGNEMNPPVTESIAKQEVSVSAFAGRHRGGGHVLYCDGHAAWMSRAAALAYPDTTGISINIPGQLIWNPAQ